MHQLVVYAASQGDLDAVSLLWSRHLQEQQRVLPTAAASLSSHDFSQAHQGQTEQSKKMKRTRKMMKKVSPFAIDVQTTILDVLHALPATDQKKKNKKKKKSQERKSQEKKSQEKKWGCDPEKYAQWICTDVLPLLLSSVCSSDRLLCDVVRWCVSRNNAFLSPASIPSYLHCFLVSLLFSLFPLFPLFSFYIYIYMYI